MRGLTLACAVLLAAIALAVEEEEKPTLEVRDPWTNVFQGKDVEIRFGVKAGKEWRGKLAWKHTAAVNDRRLSAGEADVVATPDKPGEVTVKLPALEVKPGVVLKTHLAVNLLGAGNKTVAKQERTLWIFADDPFSDRQRWLKDMKIALFDPEKTTAEALSKLKVPFDDIVSVPALGAVKDGRLLVGEGVSFKEYPDLGEALIRAAGGGLPVLCLAPSAGSMPVPGAAGGKGPQPRTVSWRRRDHITTLDARLDATAWPPDNKVLASSLALKAEDGVVVAEVGKGADDWPWLEAEFPTGKGRLIVCGFGLFGKAWTAGPAPRYLFARILETLTDKTETRDSQDKETNR